MASKSDIALIKALGGSSYTPKQAAALVRSLGGYVDPNFTLSYSGVAPEPRSSAGGSALGALKKIGSTALKALSVPQAIAFTTLQKSGHLLAPGAVRDMSWKNLGGSFYKNYKGGAGLLEGVGVSNGAVKRWGGLGLDIFADPLWFVAPVKAVKGSAKAKDLMYASKSTKAAAKKVSTVFDKHIAKAARVDADGYYDLGALVKEGLKSAEQQSGKTAGKWNLRIGTKKFNVELPTPFKTKAKKLGEDGKVHAFKNSPEMELGHRARRVSDEAAAAQLPVLQKRVKDLGVDNRDYRVLAGLERTLDQGSTVRHEIKRVLDELPNGAAYRQFADELVGQMSKAGRAEGRLLDDFVLSHPKPVTGEPVPWNPKKLADADDIDTYIAAEIRRDRKTSYLPRRLTKETDHAIRKERQKLVDAGDPGGMDAGQAFATKHDPRVTTRNRYTMGITNPDRAQALDSPIAGVTLDTFKSLLDDQGLAARITKNADPGDFAKANTVMRIGGNEVQMLPELDPLVTVAMRLQQTVKKLTHTGVKDIIARRGIKGDVAEHLQSTLSHVADSSAIQGHKLGRQLKTGIGGLKATYTFVNPGHYFNNMWGDARNAMLNGNWRHLGSAFASVPRRKLWKLANGDPDMLKAAFVIDGNKVLGEDLVALSHVVGLGTGQAKSEMLEITGWLSNKHNPVGFMARTNHKREAAQRMSTWVKHMQAGDDPLVAAEKMRRVHFDYSELTPFEENWARNAILFYTWIKKNGLLQMGGVLTRPGFYNLINSFARAMPDMGDAPDYLREATWLPLPGIGGITFADPAQDLRKLDLTGKNLRQTLLGPVNPLVRVPFELGLNKTAFTGAEIDRGIPRQHWLAGLFGGPQVQSRKDGPYAPGMNPQLAYIMDQFTGPLGSLGGAVSKSDSEKPWWVELVGRWSGAKPFYATPEAWGRARDAEESTQKRLESLYNSRVLGG